mgnify:CR=1 FL=1
MNCRYCRTWNHDEEHRCVRCGRRLHLANARPAPDTYPIQTATAPDLYAHHQVVAEQAPPPVVEPQPPRIVYQRALFREMQGVMQIPVLPSAEFRDTKPRHSRPRPPRRPHADQQAFDFTSTRVRTSLEAVIYTDAPVATPEHRMIAAAIDASLVLMAVSVFVVTFYAAGGTIDSRALGAFGGVAAVLWVLYQGLFCLANGDTPGTAWAQLQDITFDGQRPTRRQRGFRLFGMCVSLIAAGLGVLWALVDEEKLTWFDHMSRTFPTPRNS